MFPPRHLAVFSSRLTALCAVIACAGWSWIARSADGLTTEGKGGCPGQELFTDGTPCSIQIRVSEQNLEKLRKESREFVPVEIVEDGILYQKVAAHLKGSVGSFRPVDDKPGFTLDFARFQPGQKFHGLRRIHLNNSVEDPSFCDEEIGSELFRSAGIPAPRVSRTIVTLNGRRLGLYVLKEGFTEDFLSCYFKSIGGNLYEPGEGHDVNQRLKKTSVQARSGDRKVLKALSGAALEPDLDRRWSKMNDALEVDRFVRFMALEVMIGHRDGYCLARNNFRVYQDLDTGKMIFFPQGMDQLFGIADLPWMPHMAGLVAKAIMETPEGKERYATTFRSLFEAVFKPNLLDGRLDDIVRTLGSALNASEFEALKAQVVLVKDRIIERHHQLELQLKEPLPSDLRFTNGISSLAGWITMDAPASGEMNKVIEPTGGTVCLHIATSGQASSSWRAKAQLPAGHYRFEGKVRVSGVKPLGFGAHHGAGLRIGGHERQCNDLIGDSAWVRLVEHFNINPSGAEVEFICELRASEGEAWFDCSSLRVVQEQ
jgi:hypothetical protein